MVADLGDAALLALASMSAFAFSSAANLCLRHEAALLGARRLRRLEPMLQCGPGAGPGSVQRSGTGRSRLEGYVWHSNRHTFASRLVMAGEDLRTVQELGGWRSLSTVQNYAHLAPVHQLAAVEALVGV